MKTEQNILLVCVFPSLFNDKATGKAKVQERSAKTISHAAKQTEKLQIKLAVSLRHSILISDQPILVLTSTRISEFESLM